MAMRIHDNIKKALEELIMLDKLFYFYYFLSRIRYVEDNTCPTMYVTMKNYQLVMGYNREWMEDLTLPELKYLLLHEISHLLGNHLGRGIGFDRQTANIAMDKIINYLLDKHHGKDAPLEHMRVIQHPIYTLERHNKYMEKNGGLYDKLGVKEKAEEFGQKQIGKPMGCEIDKEYLDLVAKGEKSLIWEELYEWMIQNNPPQQVTFDVHGEPMSEADRESMEQIVTRISEQSKMDCERNGHGSRKGYSEEMMELLLRKPKRNNLKTLKRMIGAAKGSVKAQSFRRINRRITGIKGTVRVSQQINVLLDVSGSMYGRFEKVISEIFKDGYEINLVQCDTEVSSHLTIKDKSELTNFAIKGLGGTDMQPGIEYIKSNSKLSKLPTVLLTDGEMDTIDLDGTFQWLLISCNRPVPYKGGRNVKSIIIEDGK